MNDKAEKVLEFNKIKDLLAQEAVSPMAKKAVGEIVPLTDDFLIRDLLKETDEAAAIVSAAGAPPFGGLYDVKRSVRYAEKGGVLSMRELLDIKSSLQTASQVKNFLLVTVAEGPLAGKQFPVVTGLAEMLSEERRLCDHIDRCILSEDEMADGASPLLRDIRRKISQHTHFSFEAILQNQPAQIFSICRNLDSALYSVYAEHADARHLDMRLGTVLQDFLHRLQ